MAQGDRICPPDCDRRRVGCHAGCPEYGGFSLRQEKKQIERDRARVKADYNGALAMKLARYEHNHRK